MTNPKEIFENLKFRIQNLDIMLIKRGIGEKETITSHSQRVTKFQLLLLFAEFAVFLYISHSDDQGGGIQARIHLLRT